MSRTPWEGMYWLVRMDARLGEHRDVVTNALRKLAPPAAMASRWGVRNQGWPAALIMSQRWSSTRMKIRLRLLGAAARNPGAAQPGAEVSVLIRPEDVHVLPGGEAGSNRLPGKVSFIRDIGATVEILVDCAGQEVIAMMTPKDRPSVTLGMEVAVECPEDACAVLTD